MLVLKMKHDINQMGTHRPTTLIYCFSRHVGYDHLYENLF